MKKLYKFLLFLISFFGLGCSIIILSLFIPIPLLSERVKIYQNLLYWLNDVLAGFCVFVSLLFFFLLLIALFFPSKLDNLILTKDKGQLQFSRQTIESTARYSFEDVEGMISCKVKALIKKQPEKTRIYVKLSLKESGQLLELTELVQERIESALKSSLGITVEAVNVKVTELGTGTTKTPKEKRENITKDSNIV